MLEELEKEFEEFNIRKVSYNKRTGQIAVTVTKELEKLGLSHGDFVIVGIRKNEVVIRKL